MKTWLRELWRWRGPKVTMRGCYIVVREDCIWIEALDLTGGGISAFFQDIRLAIVRGALDEDEYAFAFDTDRERLEEARARVKVLCAERR